MQNASRTGSRKSKKVRGRNQSPLIPGITPELLPNTAAVSAAGKVSQMRQEKLISKMIDLEDRANAHASQYLKLLSVPQKRTSASIHYQKALKLRARVQELIRKIALCDSARS